MAPDSRAALCGRWDLYPATPRLGSTAIVDYWGTRGQHHPLGPRSHVCGPFCTHLAMHKNSQVLL